MGKAGKTGLVILAVIVVLGVVTFIFGTVGMDEIRQYRIQDIDLTRIKDGTYSGECTISRWNNVVRVTVRDHKIVKIALVKRRMSNIQQSMITAINRKVIEKQSPKMDAVTGASITGKAYRIAIADALHKAMRD